MASTVKRLSAVFLAAWFAVFSVLVPINAQAAIYNAASNITGSSWYVPAASTGVAGSRVVAAAATALGRANPWIGAITLGMPIMEHLLELRNGTTIAVAPSPEALPTPPGWRGPNLPPETATPIAGGTSAPNGTATVPATAVAFGSGPTYATTYQGFCSKYAALYGPTVTVTECSPIVNNGLTVGVHWKFSNGQTGDGGAITYACPSGTLSGFQCLNVSTCSNGTSPISGICYDSPTCPTGYVINYDACILAENEITKVKWPPLWNDNLPTLVPDTSGKWKVFERSTSPLPTTISEATINSDLINSTQVYTQDAYGNPVSTNVLPNTAGGYTFTQQVQTTNNNQTTTTTNSYTTNAAGNVTNISTTTNNGPITNITNTAAVQFPTDYNREATQAKILSGEGGQSAPDFATEITTKTEQLKKGVTDLLDPITGEYTSDKDKWFSWVWTPPVGVCSPFIGTVHGMEVKWDICPYIAKVRDVIGWLFAIFGAWMIYNEMFRRED